MPEPTLPEENAALAEEFRERRGIWLMWFAVFAGPLAWLVGLNAAYALVRVACAKESMLYLHAVSLLTLLLALSGGAVAHREWRRSGATWDDERGGTLPRTRFMTAVGILGSGLFAAVIIAQWVANLFLHPCMGI
jgi:hypothetical protein